MYRGYLNRKKETHSRAGQQQANTPSVPVSHSSASLASSFSSFAPSSVLPAATPSNSSQSDISSSDHSALNRGPSISPKSRFFPPSISAGPRSTTPAPMGQANSTADSPPHSPVAQHYSSAAPVSPPSSNPLKRILGGRRKKSEDVTAIFANAQNVSYDKGKERAHNVFPMSSVSSTPASSVDDLQVQHDVNLARTPSRTKRFLQLQMPFKKHSHSSKTMKTPDIAPPPPPKAVHPQALKRSSEGEVREAAATIRPGMSAAIQLLQTQGSSLSPSLKDKAEAELKQDWRKSDSTVMSYVTIRPGALTSGRSTRPVSLAESSHSGHTIVPVNKRLSALLTDSEFATPEEDDSDSEQDIIPVTVSGGPSPTSSLKARNRRSASLNFGSSHTLKAASEAHVFAGFSAMPRLSRTLTDTNLRESSIPLPAHAASGSTRSKLAAWTGPMPDRAPPVQQQQRRPSPPTQVRRPKMSISGGGFAPAAFGLGRRAAEKVHRVWEGLSSGSSNQSAHSSSSTSLADMSGRAVSRQSIYGLQSSLPGAWKQQRRTPGSSSISSSINSIESDSFCTPTGPMLGPCLRGPKRNAVGTSVIGGVVFGRDLQTCVRETIIDNARAVLEQQARPMEVGSVKPLQQRLLPAIVVRCYQHLMRWGMEEEGLFRINGRASHVAKLRSEFDTGADYDLVKSDPGDLDPHAIASIFKAYLRELPESLLTGNLVPLFESSLPKESGATQQTATASRGVLSLRKPPSLSTLAMPSFAGQRTVPDETVRVLASLIAQLPVENRDLLFTVVELINATSAASKETKMPLGNLLLLFCPSMGVSHTLLRVLCEAKDIWTPPQQNDVQTPTLPDAVDVSHGSTPSVISNDSSPSQTDSESELSSMAVARPRPGKRRGPVATLLDVPGTSMYRSSSGSGQDDAASYMSALDGSASVSNDSSTHLPALTTSTDSIATPSTMSEVSSLQQSAVICPEREYKPESIGSPPDEPNVDGLSMPEPTRRPVISAPIPFPSSGESSPGTPLSPRKSMALLSFPPLRKSDSDMSGASHLPKRPSLTLLFTKKSITSLKSPAHSQESTITPADVQQIPKSVSPTPPLLDTSISSSPIHLFNPVGESKQEGSNIGDLLSAKEPAWQGRERKDSSPGSSMFSTPQQTPIADYFRGRSKSILSVYDAGDRMSTDASPRLSPSTLPPLTSSSQVSLTPSIDIGIGSTVEDDWAQSVIEEVQATTSTPTKSRWRVSKLF